MLSNTITLSNDGGTTTADYDLVSRQGMESVRREVGIDSALGSALVIKNTVDINSPTAKNRHLIQLVTNEEISGELYPFSVHVVISRDKTVTDSAIKLKLVELADLISTSASMDDILVGGN